MSSKKGKNHFVLITSMNFPQGGAASNYLNLFCKGVKRNGTYIEVLLLKGYLFRNHKTNDRRVNSTEYGVKYKYLGFINRPIYPFLKILDELVSALMLIGHLFTFLAKRKKLTVLVYNNEVHSNLIIYFWCRLCAINLISFVPEFYDKSVFSGGFFRKIKWYGFLCNFYFLNKLSSKLIVFSQYIKDKYIEMKYLEQNILVQPNLTDFGYWLIDSKQNYTIGYSGTPSKKDGIEYLFKAIKLLKTKDIKVSVIIIGDNIAGNSLIPSLELLCSDLGISDCVSFSGLVSQNEVRVFLNSCKILAVTRPVITQAKAGFPTKLGEYFACKKVVLSTNIGDTSKYFEDKKEIILAQSEDPQSIADNIEWILANPEIVDKIVKDGYIKAMSLLDYTKQVPLMLNFILSNKN